MEEDGLKGRILKKLNSSIPPQVGYLVQSSPRHHALHESPPRPQYLQPPPDHPRRALRQLRPLCRSAHNVDGEHGHRPPPPPVDVAELVRYSEETTDTSWPEDRKENIRPTPTSSAAPTEEITPPLPPSLPLPGKEDYRTTQWISSSNGHNRRKQPPQEHNSPPPPTSGRPEVINIPSYRRPDFNSCSLFDPDLLAAFQQAVMEKTLASLELCRKPQSSANKEEGQLRGREGQQLGRQQKQEEQEEEEEQVEPPPYKVPRTNNADGRWGQVDADHYLRGFELRCPPGGSDAVVLYTTSLRGIRKTFEDCNSVRFLLRSLRVTTHERDMSMHLGYREELWRILGDRVIPPRLFIRGRYVGGADEVLGLHEQGRLLPLLRGMLIDLSGGLPCHWCGGVRFVLCVECSGSCKMYEAGREQAVRCPHCNENGLVVCEFCCR